MTANLDLPDLTRAVDAGDIDTVLVAFPDMQGRLLGKRITGRHFLESARNRRYERFGRELMGRMYTRGCLTGDHTKDKRHADIQNRGTSGTVRSNAG